jgi:hypothetical protein
MPQRFGGNLGALLSSSARLRFTDRNQNAQRCACRLAGQLIFSDALPAESNATDEPHNQHDHNNCSYQTQT